MTSSGMKRGLAATAVSALAVTGLPFLTATASATPLTAQAIAADAVKFYSQDAGTPAAGAQVAGAGVSTKNDGQNQTISLVVGGGANVTSVQYQYKASSATTWSDISSPVGRNVDGAFQLDWAASGVTGTIDLRAVPNTGLPNAVTMAGVVVHDATATGTDTVELSTEGAIGVFQSPYTNGTAGADPGAQWVSVRGTTSGAVSVNIDDRSSGTAAAETVTATDADGAGSGTTGEFAAKVSIEGYSYSSGTEANQIAFGAKTADTDDVEASTLYVQRIAGITAEPASQEVASGDTADIVLTVVDQFGKPVAGAEVGQYTTATNGTVTSNVLGATDANGEYTDTESAAGTYKYYVNTTDDNDFESGTDKETSATVSTYTPSLSSVVVKSDQNRTAFDIDELADDNDFTVELRDQRGNLFVGTDPVEYRWVVDPSAAGEATQTSAWGNASNNGDGTYDVAFLDDGPLLADLPVGTYTLEARRPNVGGAGLMNATPVSFEVSESEITYDEGASAQAPVNGTFVVSGNLSLIDGGSALGGRTVNITYTSGGDAKLSTTQPSGTTRGGDFTATAVTAANGDFSVSLTDPSVPSNVTPAEETGTLNSVATALQASLGPNDGTGTTDGDATNDGRDAEADLAVNWAVAPSPTSMTVDIDELIDGMVTPGRPVDLDVVVKEDLETLKDFPVTVTVNKGFLSPNADTEDELTPASAPADDALYGVWRQLGTSRTVSTGDAGEAGIVAGIQRNAGFDDDGLVSMVVTVKAGSLTESRTVTFSSSDPLNPSSVQLKRMAGEPTGEVSTSEKVKYNVFAKDQFGNLVGGESVRILDNTDAAEVQTDFFGGTAISDFKNDSASVVASSDSTVREVIEARWTTESNTYQGAVAAREESMRTVRDTDAITWVGRTAISAGLELTNNAKGSDVAFVNAPSKAKGATVKLYKVRADGTRKLIATKTANEAGNARFVVADARKMRYTKYQAFVGRTAVTFADWTPKRRIR